MAIIIYGPNPVFESLHSKRTVEKLLILAGSRNKRLLDIENLAVKKGIYVQRVNREKLFEISGTDKNQGIVAFLKEENEATVQDILNLSEKLNEPPLIALLDGIEDPHNLGAIIRSADGAGFHGIILPKRRSVGVTATVVKTSAGASNHVLSAQVSNLSYTIDELKDKGIWFVGADQSGGQIYTEVDLTGALGVVIGAEGQGLHRLVKEKCDFLVKIPMYGKVNSLNASVAAALLFFEVRRQRNLKREI